MLRHFFFSIARQACFTLLFAVGLTMLLGAVSRSGTRLLIPNGTAHGGGY